MASIRIDGAGGAVEATLDCATPPSRCVWTVNGAPAGEGLAVTLDLSAHAGQTVRIGARALWRAWYDHWATYDVPSRPGVDTTLTGYRLPREQLVDRGGGNIWTVGQVISGARFTSAPTIRANDVRLVDCLFDFDVTRTSGSKMINIARGVTGTVIEHCELSGQVLSDVGGPDMGIGGANWTARWCNIHDVNDGVRLSTGTVLEDSWVHHLVRKGTLHPDCAQITGGTGAAVRRCTLEAANPDTGDLGNAAIMIGGETARTADLTIEDNLLSGGNYTINMGGGTIDDETIVIRRNVYGGGARYGFILGWGVPAYDSNVRTDGTLLELKLR